MELNVVQRGLTDKGCLLEVGHKVVYLCHIPGGMIKIRLPDGKEDLANPLCFKELR